MAPLKGCPFASLCGTEVMQTPEQLYSWATSTSFQMRRNSETHCHCLTSFAVGAVYLLSCACLCVVVTVGLNNTKNLACMSPVQLLQGFHCGEQNLVAFIFHLSSHPSSLLSLIVSIWLERLPLSMVLMGCFHRGLRLEWIDERRSPCRGKFASCVQAHCCCSSSYSSSRQVTGKSWLQLHSPHCSQLLRCGLMHPAAMWLYKTHSLLQLHHPTEVLSYLDLWVVFYCAIAVLWSRMWVVITALWGTGSSWDVISYCNMLPRGQYGCKSHKCFPAALLAFCYHFGCRDLWKHRLLHFWKYLALYFQCPEAQLKAPLISLNPSPERLYFFLLYLVCFPVESAFSFTCTRCCVGFLICP